MIDSFPLHRLYQDGDDIVTVLPIPSLHFSDANERRNALQFIFGDEAEAAQQTSDQLKNDLFGRYFR